MGGWGQARIRSRKGYLSLINEPSWIRALCVQVPETRQDRSPSVFNPSPQNSHSAAKCSNRGSEAAIMNSLSTPKEHWYSRGDQPVGVYTGVVKSPAYADAGRVPPRRSGKPAARCMESVRTDQFRVGDSQVKVAPRCN